MDLSDLDICVGQIGDRHGVSGLEVVNQLRGARHQVIKLRDSSGEFYALRVLMEKDRDVSYFKQSFSLERECLVLEHLNAGGVRVPLVIAHGHFQGFGEYALMSWLEGEHLSVGFNRLCKSRDVDGLSEIMLELATLFINVHSINYAQFGVIGDCSSQFGSLSELFLQSIQERCESKVFKRCYTGSVQLLLDRASRMAERVADEASPSLVIYDLHGENMMVTEQGFALFDVDYAHAGINSAEFIPIFHDLIGRFLPVGDELRLQLRQCLLEQYQSLGGVYHEELEPLIALNHFITAMIKLNYRTDATAQEKIPLYDCEIQNLVKHEQITYPQMVWPGDSL